MVVFPTPPFPLATATKYFTPGIGIFGGCGMPGPVRCGPPGPCGPPPDTGFPPPAGGIVLPSLSLF